MPLLMMILAGIIPLMVGAMIRYMKIKRNYFVGYRTKRSMVSDDTWIYANRTFGKYFMICGLLNLIYAFFDFFTNNYYHALIFALYIVTLLIGIIISIFLTERLLEKKYPSSIQSNKKKESPK